MMKKIAEFKNYFSRHLKLTPIFIAVLFLNSNLFAAEAVWTGAAGTKDWATLGNWSGITDVSELENADTVTIPAGATTYPEASAATDVTLNGKLIIGDGASVSFAGTSVLNEVEGAGGNFETGANVSVTFNGTVNLNSITLGTGTIIKFNQGTGDQTTTITTFNFGGSTINFGNSAGDIFNMGAAGTDPLDISSASTVTLAGAINTSTLTMGGAATTVTDITLPKLVISSDLTVTGGKKVTFGGNVNAGADDVKLAITGPVVLSAGFAIGNVTAPKIGDITFTGNYEGLNNSPITCAGDFTINGTAMFRGDITVGTIKVTGEMSFGSACGKIHSTGSQTYGTAGSIVNINMWRNNEYDEPTEFIAGDNETINFYANILGFNGGKQPIKLGSAYRATDLLQNVHIYGSLGTSTYPMDFIEANCNLTVDGKIIAKSLCVKGTASLGGNVTTVDPYATKTITADGTKSQIYKGDVTLNNDVVLSAGNNSVCFEGKVNGGTTKALSVGNGTDETNAIFGSSVAAKTVSVKGTTSLAGDVTTAGTQTYTGLVSLADDVILVGGKSTVTMSGGVASATTDEKSLTAGSGASATKLAVSGNTGTTTKPLKDLTVYGDFEVTSSGTINAKGDVVLEKAAFFRGNVNAGTLTVGGVTTVGLATSKIETTGVQDYKSDVKINTTNNTEQNHTFIAGDTGVTFEGKVIRYDAVTALPNLAIGDRGNSKKTDVSFKDDVSGMVNIDVYGTANFDGATAVTTSENQTYENIAASSAVSLETTDVTKKITIKGDNTVAAAVTLKASADITGSNTFAELNIGDGTQTSDITITFTAGETETINGITSKGTAANPVLITGTGNWTADLSGAATKTFEYTLIDQSTADPAQSFSPNKVKLYDYGVYNGSAATSKNWFSFVYKWNGTTTDWETVSNWTDVSGNAVSEFPESTTGVSEILIPDGCTAYPEIAAGKAYKLASIETEAAGKITLSDKNITLTGDSPLTNAGKIIFTDTGRITNNAVIPVPIMDNTQGTVEYDGTSGTITNYYTYDDTADYYNLSIKSGNWSIDSNIKAAGTFENAATLTMDTGAKIYSDFINLASGTVAGTSVTFGGACSTVEDKGTDWEPTAIFEGPGEIEFKSESVVTSYKFNTASKTTGSVTFSGKDSTNLMKISSFTDAAGSSESKFNNVSFTFPSATTIKGKIVSGTMGNITFNDDNTTLGNTLTVSSGTVTFNGNIILNKGASIDSDGNTITIAAGKTIIAKDNFTITKGDLDLSGSICCDGGTTSTDDDKSLTVQNVKVKDSAELKAKDITIGGTITPDTNGAQNISLTATNGNITIAGQSSIKATDTVTVTGNNFIFSGAIIADNLVQISTNTITLTGDSELKGLQLYLPENVNLDAESSNHKLTLTSGDIQGSSITFAPEVKVSAQDTIITVTGTATFNKALSGNEGNDFKVYGNATFSSTVDSFKDFAVTGNGSFAGDFGATGAINSLEISGDVTLKGKVKTKAAQTYNGNVILADNVTLTAGTGSAITIKAGTMGTGTSDYALILDGNVIFGTDAKINSKYVMPSPSQDSSWRALANPADDKVINIATDIFCDFDSSKTLTIKDDLTCKNFIAYSGKVTVADNKTLATSADFVAFGSHYSGDDPRYSGTDTRFAYYFGAEPDYVPVDATYTDADHLLTFAAVPSATLTAGTGSIIKTGRNFYVNGLNLSGFTLNLNTVTPATGNPTLNTTDKATPTQWGIPYAVVFNSTITNVNANGNSNGTYLTAARAQNNFDGNGNTNTNTNVQFEVPQIKEAYTVYDDVIYIAFNIPIENSNGDINKKLEAGNKLAKGGMYYNNGKIKFEKAYEDADCTKELPNGDITTPDSDGYYGFYVKTTNEKWNTDADGKNKWNPDAETLGTTLQSTDRNGKHHSVTVDLSFLEGVFVAANGFTMSDNYGIGNQADGTPDAPVYAATEDKCAPVLVAVLTGKEKHIAPSGEASIPVTEAEAQQIFDGHNFIEFRYSEPVDIGTTMLAAGGATNVGSSESLGDIQTMGTGITVKGLATIASGSVTAASKHDGTPVHSLYRKFSKTTDGTFDVQTHSVRVAIAGYVDGTVSSNGKSYYNWTSYIESAVMPSEGAIVTRIAGETQETQVKDKAGNPVAIEPTTNHPLTQLYVNQIKSTGTGVGGADEFKDIETDSLYNKWDVTPPSFAPLRYNGFTSWTNLKNPNDSTKYEALGAAYSGSTTLNAIEFHMFDDTPAYDANDDVQWFTKIGWANASDDKNVSGSAIDPDDSAADTRGGIRYCTIYNLTNQFTYLRKGDASICNFENSKNILGGAESSIFVAPENSNSTGKEDGCYFKVPLTDASGHDPKSEFQIYFNAEDSSVYVTDLAGNLLKKELYTLNTVDRSSPSVNVTAAPCGKDEMYIVFSKAINIDEIIGHTENNKAEVKLNALECIPKALKISGATDLEIDDTVPARVVHRTENATGFIIKLNRPITIDDITGGLYIEVKESAEYPYDSLSGINAKVTLVQDMAGNYADAGKQHALTDFAINVIEPEFAHNSNMLDSNGDDVQFGLYSEGSWAVHSWGRDQGNYGTLNPEYDVFMRVQDPYDLLAGKAGTLFLSNNPTDKSVSYEYNRISGRNWRIWLPEISANISPVANDNRIKLDGNADGTDPHIINYDIKLFSDSATYGGYDAGTTITFLFDTGLTVKHDGSSGIESPLYALRLSDPNDVSSLDLWSIKLKSITAQRGGVSILNNVINPLNGEKAVLRLNMASAGSVNIMVMTLDGNIVTYLNRGEVESGEQFFTWDGKNTSGKVVARGMYFIRVMGNGIDETRKVMIVK